MMAFARVDLPEPLSPTMPTLSPFLTSMFMSLRTGNLWPSDKKLTLRFSTATMLSFNSPIL